MPGRHRIWHPTWVQHGLEINVEVAIQEWLALAEGSRKTQGVPSFLSPELNKNSISASPFGELQVHRRGPKWTVSWTLHRIYSSFSVRGQSPHYTLSTWATWLLKGTWSLSLGTVFQLHCHDSIWTPYKCNSSPGLCFCFLHILRFLTNEKTIYQTKAHNTEQFKSPQTKAINNVLYSFYWIVFKEKGCVLGLYNVFLSSKCSQADDIYLGSGYNKNISQTGTLDKREGYPLNGFRYKFQNDLNIIAKVFTCLHWYH